LVKLAFNQDREAKISEAVDVGEEYVLDHLLSMSGFPDILPLALEVIEAIVDAITPDYIQEIIDEYKEELLNELLIEAIA
jgi:hypothetical protein